MVETQAMLESAEAKSQLLAWYVSGNSDPLLPLIESLQQSLDKP